MHIMPSDNTRPTTEDATLTMEDVQILDLLALHVICGTLREARR